MTQASIRAASVLDAPLLAALQGRCFPQEPWPARTFAALLGDPGTRALIAATGPEEAPEPTGFIMFRTVLYESEVITVCVLPEYRRFGFGRLLMDALTRAARADGAESVFLEVAEDNFAARALYAEKGFVQVGFRRNYYRRKEGPMSALVLRLDLGIAPDCA